MKIIDAINKINKEEKFRFRLLCDGDIYKYIGGSLYNETVGERAEWIIDNKWLNKEIEILEEEKKIPEKLKKKKTINGSFEGKTTYIYKYNEYEIGETINEIIDYLDYLKSKGE